MFRTAIKVCDSYGHMVAASVRWNLLIKTILFLQSRYTFVALLHGGCVSTLQTTARTCIKRKCQMAKCI